MSLAPRHRSMTEELAFESVASRIRERMGECTPAERKVARALLAKYPGAGFETVAGLAELAGVSQATVVRFTSRLGYRRFPDFQRALRKELELRGASPAALFERTGFSRNVSRGHAVAQLAEAPAEDIRATFASLTKHDFDTTIEALSNSKQQIWIIGGRYSGFLAQYLAASLQQLRSGVSMVPEMASLRAATLADFGSKDVLLVFDFRRYEDATRAMVQFAKSRRVTVIVITDQWLSPCATEADAVLASVASERGPFDSVVPVMAMIEAIFEALLLRIGEPARERIERIETTAQRLDLM